MRAEGGKWHATKFPELYCGLDLESNHSLWTSSFLRLERDSVGTTSCSLRAGGWSSWGFGVGEVSGAFKLSRTTSSIGELARADEGRCCNIGNLTLLYSTCTVEANGKDHYNQIILIVSWKTNCLWEGQWKNLTFLFFLHNLLQDRLHFAVKLTLIYVCIEADQNVLPFTKPFLQHWPGILKSCDPWRRNVDEKNYAGYDHAAEAMCCSKFATWFLFITCVESVPDTRSCLWGGRLWQQYLYLNKIWEQDNPIGTKFISNLLYTCTQSKQCTYIHNIKLQSV